MRSRRRGGEHSGAAAFEIRERVRLADTDATGVIYFGAYARLIEIAQTEFFRSFGYTDDVLAQEGAYLTRVHVEFDFFRPALCDDELLVRIRVGGVGMHSVRLVVEVARANDEALLAEAAVVAASIDRARTSIALPAKFAAKLRALVAPDG